MLQLRLEGHTYTHIAQQARLSRQRIQQILSPPKKIRDIVVNAYQGKCAACGLYVGNAGDVHHENINGVENYEDLPNLRLLCKSCHRKAHKGQTIPITNSHPVPLYVLKATLQRLIEIEPKDLLSVAEAAAALRLPRIIMKRWIESGIINSIRISKRIFIPKAEVERLKQ